MGDNKPVEIEVENRASLNPTQTIAVIEPMKIETPPATPVAPKKKPVKKVAKKNPAHKDGIFTPAVLVAKEITGADEFIKLRAKIIGYHSDIIKNFVDTHQSPFGQAVLVRAFSVFDKNSDGSIDKDELSIIFNFLGFSWLQDKQINGIMKRADANDNGVLELDEFKSEAPKVLKTNLVKLAKKNGGDLGFLS